MESKVKYAAIAILALVSCRKTTVTTSDPAPPEAPTPSVALPTDASILQANACGATNVPKVLSRMPCIEDFERIGPRKFGFSADSGTLAWCVAPCDPCPLDCTFLDNKSKRKSLVWFYEPADPDLRAGKITEEEAQKRGHARDAANDAFVTTLGISDLDGVRHLHGPWAYDDVVFASRGTADDKGSGVLEVGASVDGADPVFIARIELHGQRPISAPTAPVFDVTPDGKEVGFVAFSSGEMWFEASDGVRMPAATFAARVYNDTGFAAHRRGDFARSAPLFEKAASAAPNESLYPYNAACAWSRLHDPRAEASLRRAIDLGGAKLRARAKSDADFEGVRDEAWWKTLTK